ncbi:MAG TPA: hypothetical protein VNY05_45655 [Candidatus Acidoferrales bacterium]|nr:hypothetical protein [Candidatus Acidoferrales bacterium]
MRNISTSIVKPGILLLVVFAAAEAQIYPPGGGYPGGGYPGGGYPGGGYPGGGYPGRGTGTGIPIPGRSSKGKPKTDPNQPLPNFRGHLKQMDAKLISLELGDNRVLDFKRTDKTKFFKAGDEVKTPSFSPGDQLSVEAQEDQTGMTAVNVYWEKGATAQTASNADDKGGAVDTWKDAPKDGQKDAPKETSKDAAAAPPVSGQSNERVSPPAPPASRDPDDPGPPRLQRGRPNDVARQHAPEPPTQVAENNPPPVLSRPAQPEVETLDRRPTISRGDGDEDSVRMVQRPDQPLIRRAADAAMEFTQTLPAYVCQEMMSRFQSESRPANFQPIDVVSTDVVYENGREDYRNIKINGKVVKKSIEETGGSWSTGEFGTILLNLFSPFTAADFHFRRDSRAGGIMAKMYDFEVTREHSSWSIHAESQSYQPAYSGSMWIDPATARVLRIEMSAKGMPTNFPIDHVETAVDYQFIRLGDAQQYLLPVHSESLSCQRGSDNCSRNVIDFRNYHKYTGESSIKFGGEAKDK